ncbi:Succinyl-CoA ligase [ADP-forming] subunit alpha [Anaerohalosphaera lusitana]|uniref:citrate synthase (unknown stereospecificity) n=1 Tax=Anaerohalosphaera lusitana TaxID=1936003 RepID=A0A1U9NRZ0_9BACT|nr:citrate/2-methylcitrate synthase [Anaerohalosphaera lusitana]AQT70286.1 Succinyl-CoA ligase [ADP-forming] subunit alpha [Anaerohalosphaera lusitana]
MRAAKLNELLKAGDRVAVSNITGREAMSVSINSHKLCGNIVGGWALGKEAQKIEVPGRDPIEVYPTIQELLKTLPDDKQPNKVVVYSPPVAVYGEVKEIVEHGAGSVETIFIITEHVSIEVTAKIAKMCSQADIDVVGCNSLGMINVHDKVRVGAVGADNPFESFVKGSATVISNSGNMVNTMASYLQSAGVGTSYGVSTGKDALILTSLKDLLELAKDDERTKVIVLYIEPGGLYEQEAIEMLLSQDYGKPIIPYITGDILQGSNLALGHAGAVVEGKGTSATAKQQMFDDYFGVEAFDPEKRYKKDEKLIGCLKKGIRVRTLHHLPAAAGLVCDALGIDRDFRPSKPLALNPWFLDYKGAGKKLKSKLVLHKGTIPAPYKSQAKLLMKETLGANPSRRDMRNASHASSNDGKVTRIYGHSVEKEMRAGSFVSSLMLGWTGIKPSEFEAELLEKCFVASLTNGPGTISAQGAKLSTSAGNAPNTAMIASLACIGDVHGGNGRKAVEYLLGIFRDSDVDDPFAKDDKIDLDALVKTEADRFAAERSAAKEAGIDYKRIPCLGHPVFRNDAVNYDPRERIVSECLDENGKYNVFLDFYHRLAHRLKEIGISRNVWAVNLDGAIASVVLGVLWPALKEKRLTVRRVCDVAFMVFAMGRVGGAGAEYLDHQDFGSPMDMRIPVSECVTLTRSAD